MARQPATDSPQVSVIVLVYNEVDSVEPLHRELMGVLEGFGRSFEVVYIDDGSRDGSTERLGDLASRDSRVRVVSFRRNFGQTAAVQAGIDNSKGEILVFLDGDMQNDPHDIPHLLEKIDEGYDVVSGWRRDRHDAASRVIPSKIANWLIARVTGVRLSDFGCTLKAYRREVIADVKLYGEMHRFIPVFAATVGARITEVPVNHRPRTYGKSKYSLSRTSRVALDLITVKLLGSYSTKPMYFFGFAAFGLWAIAFVLAAIVIGQKLLPPHVFAHNNPLLLLSVVLVIVGVQFILMGLLAELVIRTYHESQSKPTYVVREIIERSSHKQAATNGEIRRPQPLMCGICGVASGDPAFSRDLVERMCAAMAHRGPDDQGAVALDGVTLGMRRLSIIDLEGGHQPMCNEDSTVWVVQNGEIYNHLSLREELSAAGHVFATQADTEVLVHGYEEWGEEMVGRLNGMFAFALLDRRSGRVFLARDRMGIKPLHYAVDGDRLVFASELKALLRDPSLRRGVDPVALNEYLAYEFVPSPRSIVRGIEKLQPGHTLAWSITERQARIRRYWAPTLNADGGGRGEGRSVDEECAELRSVLRESVRKELISDVPLGVFLSGGIDSSAVAAMMAELGVEVKSFSVGFAERSFDESAYARSVARHLGTEHHELTLEPAAMLDLVPRLPVLLDEPLGDASIIPTYLLSTFTRRHVKVALGGDGGDELFAGYPTLQAHRLAGYYLRAPALLRRGVVEPVVRRLPVSRDNLSFDFRAKRFVSGVGHPVAERHRRWMGSFATEERAAVLSGDVRADLDSFRDDGVSLDPLNQVLLLDMRLYLENDILVKLDRASMMASLEGRVPLLNNDFVAYATGLPLRMKLRGWRSKFLLKRALRGVLPERILRRPKKGFGVPVAEWFRGPLREQLLSVLSPERLRREGFFQPGVVGALIKEHLEGGRDNRKQLWTLFAFGMWLEGYEGLGRG